MVLGATPSLRRLILTPDAPLFVFTDSCIMLGEFFFQAEDGIRGLLVTGVQTCALPIWPGASGRGGAFARGAGGTTAGTITSVAPDQVTVSLAAGGSKLVLIDGSTTVTKVSSTDEALTDLSQGEAITVIGTANPDGSITAQRIVVGNVGDLFGAGLRRSPAASPPPSSAP